MNYEEFKRFKNERARVGKKPTNAACQRHLEHAKKSGERHYIYVDSKRMPRPVGPVYKDKTMLKKQKR